MTAIEQVYQAFRNLGQAVCDVLEPALEAWQAYQDEQDALAGYGLV